MRVIGGEHKGKRLRYPAKGLRPTRDNVKQAILNILRSRILGARVADLFCGAGALGIEALSAGAASAVFVEQDRRTLLLLRENVLVFGQRARVVAGDVLRILPRLTGERFDIILADPPYETDLEKATLGLIAEKNLLSCNGVLVLEHSRRDQPLPPIGLELLSSHHYGDTVVSVFKRQEQGI